MNLMTMPILTDRELARLPQPIRDREAFLARVKAQTTVAAQEAAAAAAEREAEAIVARSAAAAAERARIARDLEQAAARYRPDPEGRARLQALALEEREHTRSKK